MKRGFTLLELILVIIIIGILATLGFTQYAKMLEKGRTAEAKTILGQIRSAMWAYKLEYNATPATLSMLAIGAPEDCTGTSHYFQYGLSGTENATAKRCTGNAGKSPGAGTEYVVNITINGTWGGTPGYY